MKFCAKPPKGHTPCRLLDVGSGWHAMMVPDSGKPFVFQCMKPGLGFWQESLHYRGSPVMFIVFTWFTVK